MSRNSKGLRIFVFSCLVLTILGLLIFFGSPQKPLVRLSVSQWIGYAPLILADRLRIFEKHGLRVQLMFAQDPKDASRWYREGKADHFAAPLAEVIHLRANGYRTKALLVTDYSMSADSIVGLSQLDGLKDLKGRVIGIDGFNSFSHFFVLSLLQRVGLTERDVQFKLVRYNEVLNALEKGEISAGHTWDPTLSDILEKGYRSLGSAEDLPGSVWDCVGISEDFVRKNPQIAEPFFKAFHEAKNLLLSNPELYVPKVLEVFKGSTIEMTRDLKRLHFVSEEEDPSWSSVPGFLSFENQARLINEFFLKRGQTRESDPYQEIMVERKDL